MQTILDQPFEEKEAYNLWWFFLVECLLLGGGESLRYFLKGDPQSLYLALFFILCLYFIFQISTAFYKQPKFDSHPFWISIMGLGFFILILGLVYQYYQWPNIEETISTGIFLIIGAHLFLALLSTLREARPFLVIAPLWLIFLAIAFGLSASLYYGMGWKEAPGLLSAGFVVNLLCLILILLLLYFNWATYNYLLYYLPRIMWLVWICSDTLFIQPLQNPMQQFYPMF